MQTPGSRTPAPTPVLASILLPTPRAVLGLAFCSSGLDWAAEGAPIPLPPEIECSIAYELLGRESLAFVKFSKGSLIPKRSRTLVWPC